MKAILTLILLFLSLSLKAQSSLKADSNELKKCALYNSLQLSLKAINNEVKVVPPIFSNSKKKIKETEYYYDGIKTILPDSITSKIDTLIHAYKYCIHQLETDYTEKHLTIDKMRIRVMEDVTENKLKISLCPEYNSR